MVRAKFRINNRVRARVMVRLLYGRTEGGGVGRCWGNGSGSVR